jgi:hypothetical protein
MSYTYLAKVSKTGHSELRQVDAKNSEVYKNGMLVELVAGVAQACAASSTSIFGVCREAKTGATGGKVAVEVPVDSFMEVDIYADAAVTSGVKYGINANGSVATASAGLRSALLEATKTTSAAGVSRFRLVPAEPTEYKVKVRLTNANIKALRATPITMVAAPGTGKLLEFVSAQLKLNYASNVLTESADNMAFRYHNGSGAAVSETIEATGFIDQAADTYTNAIAKKDAIVAVASAQNKALVLHNTGSGEYAGNAGNDCTVDVLVTYRVHTL